MIELRFCNYNKDYQQRLGFLKVLIRVAHGARGGPDEVLERVKEIYPGGRRHTLVGQRSVVEFEPKSLIRTERVPSWIVGFVPKTLDRLVAWSEMVGLLAPSGRLSEWANILDGIHDRPADSDWNKENPFILSSEERAYFVQLLLYHDQVLPFLIHHLGQFDVGKTIGVAESCVLVTKSLGDLYDHVKGNSPAELQLRSELRDLLERIGRQYKLDDPRKLVNADSRREIVKTLAGDRLKGVRVRLAEYHAICRFEQLTDLGLLTKEAPDNPPTDDAAKEKARTSWTWHVIPGLSTAASILASHAGQLEPFFQCSWIHFCAAAIGQKTRELDAFRDQRQIASILDETLPLARRQLGPVQIHTWGSLSCLRAFGNGYLLELNTITELLDAMRGDANTSSSVRLSGRPDLRGRTAAVPKTGLYDLLKDYTVAKRETNDKT